MRISLRHFLSIASVLFQIVVFVPPAHSNTGKKVNDSKAPAPFIRKAIDRGNVFFMPAIGRYLSDTIPAIVDFDYFVSNTGSNRNDGKSAGSPKSDIDSIENLLSHLAESNKYASVGLDPNSVFREQFDVGGQNIVVGSYRMTTGTRFARITGMDIIREWKASNSQPNVYEHLLRHSIDVTRSNYNYILVAEVDTVLEKKSPVSAVKYLQLAPSLGICSQAEGTYYIDPLTSNPALVSIHPTGGVPGKSKYRYEVTTRNYAIDGHDVDGARYERLFLQSSGHGYGMISGGDNTTVRNIIFQGGGTHHMVLKSGWVDSCMFLPGPEVKGIALTFYEKVGKGNVSRVSNSMFIDIQEPFFCHVNPGDANHQKITLDNVRIFNKKDNFYTAIYDSNIDTLNILNAYVENYKVGYNGSAAISSIKNTVLRNIGQAAILMYPQAPAPNKIEVRNVVVVSNGTDLNNYNDKFPYLVRAPFRYSDVDVSNTIYHGRSTWRQEGNVIKALVVGGQLKAHRNIYICDVNNNSALHVTRADNSSGIRASTNVQSDSNVYILLRGGGFRWEVVPNNDGYEEIATLSRWQLLTGQDKNSISIDLRNHPLGLKAIFVDPENGNWTLAETPQANAIKKLGAGMTNPPLFYPARPPIDNAPPFQATGGFSSFAGKIESSTISTLEWKTFYESQLDSFGVEYSIDGSTFSPIGIVRAIGDGKNNDYKFVHTQTTSSYLNYYRLRLVDKENTSTYSSIILLERDLYDGLSFIVYPNPVRDRVTVRHPSGAAVMSIYDFFGRKLESLSIEEGITKSTLQLNHLPNGLYVLQWASLNKRLTTKIVKL